MKKVLLSLICVLQLGAMGSPVGANDYPFKDPYVATIIGTPEEFQPKLPEKIDYALLGLKVFPDRSPTDAFWYERDFRYSLTDPPKQENMAGLIGTVFRLSAGNMLLTADVRTNSGLIKPKNLVLGSADSLTDYFTVSTRTSFLDYFEELF